MPKLAVKRDTDYRLSVMIHGEMGAQNVKPEKAAEYAEKYSKKIITSSDAHYLWDINERGAYIELDCGRENAAQELINYLRGAV